MSSGGAETTIWPLTHKNLSNWLWIAGGTKLAIRSLITDVDCVKKFSTFRFVDVQVKDDLGVNNTHFTKKALEETSLSETPQIFMLHVVEYIL